MSDNNLVNATFQKDSQDAKPTWVVESTTIEATSDEEEEKS